MFEQQVRHLIANLTPSIGPRHGGTTVRVFSVGQLPLTISASCVFGDSVVGAMESNTTAITCVSPRRHVTGAVSFKIWMRHDDIGQYIGGETSEFMYAEHVQIENVRPLAGSVHGHTPIDVTGSGFTASTSIRFGHQLVQSAQISLVTSTHLKTRSPAGEVGSVAVEVSTNGVEFASNDLQYQYALEASVTQLTPSTGPEDGGTVVTVRGSGFLNNPLLECKAGVSKSLWARWRSSTIVECATSAHRPGNVTFQVSNNGAEFAGSLLKFAYINLNSLQVVKLSPSSGPLSGNTRVVVVFSTHLITDAGAGCIFGDSLVPAKPLNATQVLCQSPMRDSEGTVPLKVWIKGAEGLLEVDSRKSFFTYIFQPFE